MQAWQLDIPDAPSAQTARLRAELSIGDALAQVLVRRGYDEPEQAREFLRARVNHPPEQFDGIDTAAALVERHIAAGERITVHGDYDADGICATAVMVRSLERLGADVDSYIPDRTEGYGLSAETVEKLAARGTALIITVDCAITAVEEVELAHELGLEVLVTDHHRPRADGRLPDAPIVHPTVCGYAFAGLCGAAVAHKFAQRLETRAGIEPRGRHGDLDLVAIGTIADVVPLLEENRTLVRFGLRALAASAKPGLRALLAALHIDPRTVGERDVAFRIAPRLNAAGRLYHADAALELLMTTSAERAAAITAELERANGERRDVERRIHGEAAKQLRAAGERSGYVLAGTDWHPGVVGIVASRLAETSGCPVVLLCIEGQTARGSGRSVPGVDLLAALGDCAELLGRHGGHAGAAGLELDAGDLPALAERFDAAVLARRSAGTQEHLERVDAIVDAGAIGLPLAEELAAMGPFGEGNPPLCVLVQHALLADLQPMGEGRHLRFTVRGEGASVPAVAFGTTRLPVDEAQPAEATFTLEVNEWRGSSQARLVLRRARAAQAQTAAQAA